MFGYVVPDKPNMFVKDFTMYKAFYCGLCKTIGKNCGQFMRFSTNYDMTFLNVLAHAVFDVDVKISNETCILNPLKKRSIVKIDELSTTVNHLNNILLHFKCVDDIIDNKSLAKKFVDKIVLRRNYKKSRKIFFELDKKIDEEYKALRLLEKENCGKIDFVCDKFANIMVAIGQAIFAEKFDENLKNLLYSIGKWIYIADAIDDIQDDFVQKKYNMFLVGYDFKDKATFLADKQDELKFLLGACQGVINDSFDNIKVSKYEGVLTNIFWYGINNSTEELLRRTEKCKKIRF